MKIVAITPGTAAEAMGLSTQDELLSINDHPIKDVIDYQFYSADEELELELRSGDDIRYVSLIKGLDEDLGIIVEPMSIRSCANNCVFCFAHQNAPGVRNALNFKDGDFRFSFLHGHYITMTNMGPKQLARVVEQQLSPLYISVHVTQPEMRREMLLYGKDDDILGKLKYLTENRIQLHTQIVLCPGWNDGDILLQTLSDLEGLRPGIRSVSIVPVGLTKFRDGLPHLDSFTGESAGNFIKWFENQGYSVHSNEPDRFVYLSDEFFILADEDIPQDNYYGDFSMVENGVGQCRDFANRFHASLNLLPKRLRKPTHLVFPTGTLVHPFLQETVSRVLDRIENLSYSLLPVRNDWLGAELVTVTGLLPAQDILNQVNPPAETDAVYLSYRMFSEDGITLDDFTREQIEQKLGFPVYIHHEDFEEILSPWV